MREDKIKNKKKIRRLYLSVIGALIAVIIFHLEFGIGKFGIMVLFKGILGYVILLAGIFLFFFAILFYLNNIRRKKEIKEINEEDKLKTKKMRIELVFFIIDTFMTIMFINFNWHNLKSAGTMWAIAEIAVFFAIIWMIFELFNFFKLFPERLLHFITSFFVSVCPMLILIIPFLGAYQAKYKYIDTFTPAVKMSATTFGEKMQDVYLNIVFSLYNIGKSNPNLWIWLPIAAFFIFTLLLLINTFTKKEKTDEEKTSQEIIDEIPKFEEEERREEKRRPLAYNLIKKIKKIFNPKKEEGEEAWEYLNQKTNQC